jgi:hypothetical protein
MEGSRRTIWIGTVYADMERQTWGLDNQDLGQGWGEYCELKKDIMIQRLGVGLTPTRGAVSLPATKEGAARSAHSMELTSLHQQDFARSRPVRARNIVWHVNYDFCNWTEVRNCPLLPSLKPNKGTCQIIKVKTLNFYKAICDHQHHECCQSTFCRSMPTIQTSMMEDLSLSDMSDFEEILTPDEADSIEWGSSSSESPSPAQASFRTRERRHPPWSGHRDRLVGIVDMGR